MTSAQIELVQSSFGTIQPKAGQVARLFYARLFEIDPSLRALFRGDMEEQGRKLMQILGVAVGALRRLEQILPAVQDLGRRHSKYGVRDEHYQTVGAALLWTLHGVLGEAFTQEVCDAWLALYQELSTAMTRGAASLPTAA